jgi:hypothetical protein
MIFFGFLYSHQKPVIASLPDYESKEFYTNHGFQDYTDYAKYTYDNISIQDLESTEYFTITTADDVEEILSYIDDFEGWVEACGGELEENYDFDKTIVTEGDFFYIETKEGEPIGQGIYGKFDNYSVYYFDVDAQILYYFHNNI